MKLCWLSDLHLDFVDMLALAEFWASIRDQKPDALLIGGDLSQSQRLITDLKVIEALGIPFYFVLGNHEYYLGSIQDVRWGVQHFVEESKLGVWLGGTGVIELTPEVALIGHGCWGDARYGDVAHMKSLNDDVLIRELADLSTVALIRTLNQLGDEAAEHLRQGLEAALPKYQQVIILAHVPPFIETCLYEDSKPSPLDGLPRFACQAVGDMLKRVLPAYPDRKVTFLAGHTHTGVEVQVLPNLLVKVSWAQYGEPKIADWIEI